MDKRTILAILLCILVWLVWQALFVEPTKPQTKSSDGGQSSSAVTPQDGGSLDGGIQRTETPVAEAAPPQDRPPEKKVILKTDLYEAEFSSREASVKGLKVLKYHERNEAKKKTELGKQDLVSGEGEKGQLFTLRFRPESTSFKFPAFSDWEVVESTDSSVQFRYTDPTQQDFPVITKTFTTVPGSYLLDLDIEVANHSSGSISEQIMLDVVAGYQVIQSSGCMGGCGGAAAAPRVPSCLVNEEMVTVDATPGSAKTMEPAVRWTGINEQYFLIAAINKGAGKAVCLMEARRDKLLSASLMYPETSIAPGTSAKQEYRLFCGPKELEILGQTKVAANAAAADAGLSRAVDFGWLSVLCHPMLWLLKTFYSIVGNFGIAIIFLTVIMRLLLWPVTQKQTKSMREMAKLKPLMDDLKKKYGDDKQRYQQELMNLYKVHKVSPFSGCLPMLLQMPIWIALYRTLYSAVELYQTPFVPGWIDDLSYRDPYFIMPIAMGVAMFLQQKLTPTTVDSQQAKMMLYFMPIMFTFMMLYLPAGLTLYIFVSSLLSVVTTVLYNRKQAGGQKPGVPTPKNARATV